MSETSCVFVVDDDPSVRRSLTFLMESIHLSVRTYESAQDFLDRCDPDPTGCVVLDLRMPGMSGLELLERMPALGISLPVIVITGYADVPTAVRALKAGAWDFLQKPFSDQILLERIQEAIRANRQAKQEVARRQSLAKRMQSLTHRQREILDLVVAGETSKAIAERLGIALSTVEGHRIQIMRKLGASNVAELVRLTSSSEPPPGPLGNLPTETDPRSEN